MATLKSLSEIFNNTLFRIPDYQRGYAWTPNQLKDFWDDLYNLNKHKNHYTGVLTVKGVPTSVSNTEKWNDEQWVLKERGYKAFYVVDGQQRLTTSIVFIQSMVELIQGLSKHKEEKESEIYLGSFSLKEIRESYLVVKKPPHGIIRTYKFGYECDNPSFTYLRYKIFNDDGGGTVDETFYTLNLENAKRFFIEKLKGVMELEGEDGLSELFIKLTINFKYNLYEIEEDFDVFVAFETMNNRGKKLSNLELLKNRLIYLTTLYDAHELKEDDRTSLRRDIDEAWKEVYYQLGRNKSNPLNDDEFLVAHWIMYFQYSRQKGDDYINFLLNNYFTPKNIFEKIEIPVNNLEEFREYTDAEEDLEEDNTDLSELTLSKSKLRPKEIEDYIHSLKAAAIHWYNTHNPINNADLQPDEQVWIDRLNRIGIAYFRPLVTASFLNTSITTEERVKLFKAIERFIFIAFRLSRAFSSYRNSEFYKAARFLNRGEWSVDYVSSLLNTRIDYAFYVNEESPRRWFNYEYFHVYVEKHFKNGGGFYWWNGLRYFLYEYEMHLVKKRGSQRIDWNLFVKGEKDKVSIEHILPQTPDADCWKVAMKGVPKKHHQYLKGTLGNLVPLSQSINSSLQNDCFEEKKQPRFDENGNKTRSGYDDGSHSEIEISRNTQWTPAEIMKRGIDLLTFMEKRWKLEFESEEDKVMLLGLTFLNEEQ